jgi:hypothetical protein
MYDSQMFNNAHLVYANLSIAACTLIASSVEY